MPERPEFERMESFSNPIAPPEMMEDELEGEDHQPLSNADFRKMLMTPRAPKPGESHVKTLPSVRKNSDANIEEGDDPAERRRKKKIYYAKLKRLEEERQKELAEKYRDRARERRDGHNDDQADTISTTADYRAVAPDAKSVENLAERRKQVIQESKYLGGDMEHTHLVKGLDYALLEKVRAEISSKELQEEQEMEKAVSQDAKEKKEEEPEEHIQFKTKMGRNIYRTLFKSKDTGRNELFIQGRMAYVVDLEDEFADSDVPTTTIRSKADCPSLEVSTTLTTNDIVINKLTQILSYLRQGRRESKKLKKLKGKLREAEKLQGKVPGADDNIYSDLTDYVPSVGKSKDKKDRGKDRDRDDRDRRDRDRDRDRRDKDRDRDRDRRDRDRDRDRGRSDRGRDDKGERKRKSYFEKPTEEDEDRNRPNANVKELVKTVTDRYRGFAEMEEEKERKAAKKEEERIQKLKQKTEIDSYAECYPGMEEAADAVDDSDDEVDYTKMDQGNKKGPVGRWDFDTQEEYSDYMANKEALPKAAFQYGVKMSDGRKTRRAGPKDEKAELDRQWQQIQNIMNKRKGDDYRGDDRKKSKY
ncbi:protein Red-like [Mercenaria mercenaria]|uniref:protein Red-like n=1 Tax=Mercenaria mercenaria TaxID=6596 RepID=UPI00234F5517|nr:protein Red-like [Mercenaria mercenaria]